MKLSFYVFLVSINCFNAEVQFLCDFYSSETFSYKSENLELAVRKCTDKV